MPSILLINENKIVSRLLQLSSEKNGYNLEEVTALDSSGDSYDIIFVDSDKYSDALMGQIESKLNYEQLGYIGTKQETAPEGFNLVIEKPFLPTDFVDMIKEQVISKKPTNVIADTVADKELENFDMDDEADMLLNDDKLDLDDLEDINEGVEHLLISDELDKELSLDDLEASDDIDLSLDSTLVMTTGVAASMAVAEGTPEDLTDIVNDIDLMEEDTLVEELSLDEDEMSVDSIDELALMGATPVGTVASKTIEMDEAGTDLEEIEDEISTLDDIDDLNEVDLKHALDEEVIEEVISDEIVSDGEETLVESNDVEQWIRDAVQKAITPQMIKEALDGMDVNVTLSFNSKKDS